MAMPTSTNAEKEDDADSTATTITTAATSISGSEWEDHITEGLLKTPPEKIPTCLENNVVSSLLGSGK